MTATLDPGVTDTAPPQPEPAPEPQLTIRDYNDVLNARYPHSVGVTAELAPFIPREPWDAAKAQCAAEEEQAAWEIWNDEAASDERVFGPLDAWLRCRDLYAAQALSDSVPVAAASDGAAGTGSSSGPAEEPPPPSAGPAPDATAVLEVTP